MTQGKDPATDDSAAKNILWRCTPEKNVRWAADLLLGADKDYDVGENESALAAATIALGVLELAKAKRALDVVYAWHDQ